MSGLTDWPWRQWARRRPDDMALLAGDERVSWAQLAEQIERLAIGFRQQGVHDGCGVMLRAEKDKAAVLTYLSLLRCGARLLPINPQLPYAQLRALLPSLNVDFTLDLAAAPLSGPDPHSLRATAQAATPLLSPASGIPSLRLMAPEGSLFHPWDRQAIATLTLTSGSGGLPKAVAHTFSAHLASAAGVTDRLGFTSSDAWLLSLPLFHVSGQGILWRWLHAGATLALAGDRPLHEALAASTFASLVPTQLWRLLRQPALPAKLHSVLLGGAAIPEALTAEAEARDIACWCGYGMTETASTVAAARADGRGGVGLALADHQIALVDGEIRLKSAALGLGYWRNGDLLPLTDKAGWFATRDRGHWAEGGLQITGRTDNLFFSAGEGIQPERIERILLEHPAISQVFIVPLPDEEYGNRPVALVTADVPPGELAEWARQRLAGFQRPVRWYPLPELSAGGIKISRRRLADWVREQEKRR